jgi:hypothetical protein
MHGHHPLAGTSKQSPVLSAPACSWPGLHPTCVCYKPTAGGRLGGGHTLDGMDSLLVCGARRLGPRCCLCQHP